MGNDELTDAQRRRFHDSNITAVLTGVLGSLTDAEHAKIREPANQVWLMEELKKAVHRVAGRDGRRPGSRIGRGL